MARIEVKPISINTCFQGRRFRTKEYDKYEKIVLAQLVSFKVPDPPYRLDLTVGYSNPLNDLDNAIKPFLDCLQKRYGFNDRDVYEIHAKKIIVKKKHEFVEFNLSHIG